MATIYRVDSTVSLGSSIPIYAQEHTGFLKHAPPSSSPRTNCRHSATSPSFVSVAFLASKLCAFPLCLYVEENAGPGDIICISEQTHPSRQHPQLPRVRR